MLTSGLWAQQGLEHRYLSSRTLVVIYKYLEDGEPTPATIGEFAQTNIDEIKDKMAELREFY